MAKEILVKVDTGSTLPLDYLKPLQGDLKELSDESAKKLKASILKYGFIFPFFVWENPIDGDIYILDGHQRLKVLQDLKDKKYLIPQLPVVMIPAENIDEAKAKLASVASHFGEFTASGIQTFFDSFKFDESLFQTINIPTFEVPSYGEDKIQVAGYEREKSTYSEGEDDVPEISSLNVKSGDIFILGNHRLMCGDSLNREMVSALMNGNLADMVFTDPPYGVDYEGGALSKREKLSGDHKKTDIYKEVMPILYDFTVEKSPFYIWHAAGYADMAMHVIENKMQIRSQLIWNKNIAQFGALSAQYKQKHEPCFYCFKKGYSPYWYGPTNEVTVWDVKRESKNEFHPTQRPVELIERALANSSEKNSLVMDLFGGSGSTLIGCEKMDRLCFMMELDPNYVGVILERWEKFSGKEAFRLNRDGSKVEWSKIKNTKLKKK